MSFSDFIAWGRFSVANRLSSSSVCRGENRGLWGGAEMGVKIGVDRLLVLRVIDIEVGGDKVVGLMEYSE